MLPLLCHGFVKDCHNQAMQPDLFPERRPILQNKR